MAIGFRDIVGQTPLLLSGNVQVHLDLECISVRKPARTKRPATVDVASQGTEERHSCYRVSYAVLFLVHCFPARPAVPQGVLWEGRPGPDRHRQRVGGSPDTDRHIAARNGYPLICCFLAHHVPSWKDVCLGMSKPKAQIVKSRFAREVPVLLVIRVEGPGCHRFAYRQPARVPVVAC